MAVLTREASSEGGDECVFMHVILGDELVYLVIFYLPPPKNGVIVRERPFLDLEI